MDGKKGFWNYTEPITFNVLNVVIEPVKHPPTHWQNCYVGTTRQVVEVTDGDSVFFMDNEDGSGLRKIARDGGPDSFHREVKVFTDPGFSNYLPAEEWKTYDQVKHYEFEQTQDAWMAANFPEEWKQVQSLKEGAKKYKNLGNDGCSSKTVNLGAVGCDVPNLHAHDKPLSKKKIKKNAQKARRNGTKN